MAAPQIICFGECMLELSRTVLGGSHWNLGVAGDTYNVAVYLKRLGKDAAYMSALGRDPFSQEMLTAWKGEGISDEYVVTHPDRIPGLYAIRVDESGERSFEYWRNQSAARAFFECSGASALMQRAANTSVLYLSGITLSLFSDAERAQINTLAKSVRASGGDVIFDSNYRPRGWPDKPTAQRVIEDFARQVTIALPTLEDDRALFGDDGHEACARRWLGFGVREVAVKLGDAGSFVATRDLTELVAPEKIVVPKDTTGAGDSFNAGFIAARIDGHDIAEAAQIGNRLAAEVVQHQGAIIRKVLMPSYTRITTRRA
jgi:2-dehydro-3-deoxygluconokinase